MSTQIVQIVGTQPTPVSLNDVKFAKLNTDTIMVADMARIYNSEEDIDKMEDLIESNSKGEPCGLPEVALKYGYGHKGVHSDNYDILDVPVKLVIKRNLKG